jgi:hypothetical protein
MTCAWNHNRAGSESLWIRFLVPAVRRLRRRAGPQVPADRGEGLVFKSTISDDSFKAISNKYLLNESKRLAVPP